jgi:transcriptional regulator with XRE-family HTH domain
MSAQQESRPTISIQIGTAAREARKQTKLTQEEVAERVGIAPEVYGRIERGVIMPSVPTLKKICQTLGVNAGGLLGIEMKQPLAPSAPRQAGKEDPPEFRKLLRRLRTLDKAQLAAIRTVANLMQTQSARRGSRKTTQRGSKSAKRAPHGK